MRAGEFGEGHQVIDTFSLNLHWARWFVPFRAGLSRRQKFGLFLRDQFGIFAMRGDDHAQLFGEFQRLIQFAIIDRERAFVGEKNLKG